MFTRCIFSIALLAVACDGSIGLGAELVPVGVAAVDITPDYPIRLSGYGNRTTETNEVAQKIWAKALAIGADGNQAALIITVDNCGVPMSVTDELSRRLLAKVGIPRERLAVCSSHSHTAPCLTGVLPLLFGKPIVPEEQASIDRYTGELSDKLEQVALAALADRKPARLTWAQGKVDFAANRRTAGGPADHSLPALFVWSETDQLRAVFVNYACHATTLGGEFNKICGDWPGYAQAAIERDHPGAVALVAIGCGADANPNVRLQLENAVRHGETIAHEINRLLAAEQLPLSPSVDCRWEQIEIPFAQAPDLEKWQALAKSTHQATAYHARVQLERLKSGQPLQAKLDYPVQVWCFGDDLAMVFLAGEVVVDYSLRIKELLDAKRVWVNAYSNDVPCYIASKRVLAEGGYEADSSMIYYGRPTRLDPVVEDKILDTVQRLTPAGFYSKETQANYPAPLTAERSVAAIKVPVGLKVELVASDPLVVDPVYIDFGSDGRLWVAEMRDYPEGIHGDYKPGGRVKVLTDTTGDGKYDSAAVFLDEVPFPTGLMEWNKGVLIAAAPDVLYAEDTDGDGKADIREVLYTGFYTENYQARVNGFVYGLDNWVYGSCGLFGGKITNKRTGEVVDISSRDFRFDPRTGILEAATGQTQQGRIRDDWGNWFGNTNSALLFHYPLQEHYIRRNPHVASPSSRVHVPVGKEVNRLYPASVTLERYNYPDAANQVTSACGPSIYRDVLLGENYFGNAFACEPVHNLVTRRLLQAHGTTFQGIRDQSETESEFLASTDNWFRPVQTITGPDGGFWVVDMYRFLIEHPKWITEDRRAKLDIRAGEDRGRIYRVVPEGTPVVGPAVPVAGLTDTELAHRMDSSNGPMRDLVQRLLCHRQATEVSPVLREILKSSPWPAARLQALCTLQGLGTIGVEDLHVGLDDKSAHVRRHAIRLAEPFFPKDEQLATKVLAQAADTDPFVQQQLALSLGEWESPLAGETLARLAVGDCSDTYLRAAILSSSIRHPLAVVSQAVASSDTHPAVLQGLLELASGIEDQRPLSLLIGRIADTDSGLSLIRQWEFISHWLDTLGRKRQSLVSIHMAGTPALKDSIEKIRPLLAKVPDYVSNPSSPMAERVAAIRLIGRGFDTPDEGADSLAELLSLNSPAEIQLAAVNTLGKLNSEKVPATVLAGWNSHGPRLRADILAILFRRDDWTIALLESIGRGDVPMTAIGAIERQQLGERKSETIRKLAASVFDVGNSTRAQVLSELAPAAKIPGDVERGKQVFQKSCSACHQLFGVGHVVGPDLRMLTDKSPAALLTAVLDPNRAVETKFVSYSALMLDGQLFSGMLVNETGNSITLRAQEGKEHVILRQDLEALQSSGKSYMPEGLEKDLTAQNLADVMRYIGTLGHTP